MLSAPENISGRPPFRWRRLLLIFLGVAAILANIQMIMTIFGQYSTEWFSLNTLTLLFVAPFDLPFLIIALILYVRRSSFVPPVWIFLPCLLTFIAIFPLLYFAQTTHYFVDKNRGESKTFVSGTESGTSLEYLYSNYGLLFTYPKDWNLVIQETQPFELKGVKKGIEGDIILLTPYDRWHFYEKGETSMQIRPMNDTPLSDADMTAKIDEHLKWQESRGFRVQGREVIGGKSFPFVAPPSDMFTGLDGQRSNETSRYRQYYFVHRGILFEASYDLRPYDKNIETVYLDILHKLQYQ